MRSSFNFYHLLRAFALTIMVAMISLSGVSQSCDFTTGTVNLSVTGGNQTDAYNTIFVLTSADGTILAVNENVASFEILNQGFYAAYSVNSRDGSTVTGLTVGENISDIGVSDCFDLSAPYGFTVCVELSVCNYCLGESVNLDPFGESTDPLFTNRYLLTDNNGIILSIQESPVWPDLDPGIYLAFSINFETSSNPVGIETSLNIADIESGIVNITGPEVIGVCDQLDPTIFFDLKACDITETAVLVVSEAFNTYTWSTGSTEDFIEVSATDVATYTVTVTLDNGCIGVKSQRITGEEIARLGDFVWEDTNADGRQDNDEAGINGVTVNLYADFDRNGSPDFADFPSCITTTGNHPTTGEAGWYEFTLYQSNYVLEFVAPTGFVATTINEGDDVGDSDIRSNGFTESIEIIQNTTINNVDAGFRTSTAICGIVWEDLDGDGRRDNDEVGIDGITLNLYTADDELVATTVSLTDPTSNVAGTYCFDDIPVRDYYVEIVLPNGRAISPANIGTDDSIDSDASGLNGFGTTGLVQTGPGENVGNVDFGIYTGGVVCGLVWMDQAPGTENVYDEGTDSLIEDSQVLLVDANSGFNTLITFTDENGRYCLEGIPVGSYTIVFGVNGDGESYVQPNQGDDPLLDSDVDINTATTGAFFIAPGDNIQGVNAGIRLEALPIELLSFSGNWDEATGTIILDWATASEINNDYFDIERVVGNSGDFLAVGQVTGGGTTTATLNYSYQDLGIKKSGTYYYRLKQVDYDGGYDYSNIIAIDVLLNNQAGIKVFPNPVTETFQLDLYVGQEDYANIKLTDFMGRDLSQVLAKKLFAGHNIIDINVKDIPSGAYMLTVSIGSYKQYELIQVAN